MPSRSSVQTASAHIYDLCGASLRVSCADPTLRQCIATILRRKGATSLPSPDDVPPAPSAFTLTAERTTALSSLPAQARFLGRFEPVGLEAWRHGDRLYVRGHGAWAEVSPPEARLILRSDRDVRTSRGPTPSITHLVGLMVVSLLHTRHWITLHAAVLAREERGIVLLAESDAGKSTTAFQLVRQGWSYVSDDTVLVRADEGKCEVVSFRPHFCLDTDTARYFPELLSRTWPLMERDEAKWRVDVGQLYPGRFLSTCRPVVLVWPSIADAAASTVTPISSKETLPILLRQSGFVLNAGTPRASVHFDLLGQFLRQCATYRLHSGQDVLHDGAALDRLLRPLLSQRTP